MKRITKIKWLKVSLIISIVMICLYAIAQDDPSGYTSWFRLRMWEEGDHPGADSVNQNLIDIDLHLHNRDKRIDSLKSAYTEMFNFPAGTWKRYDSTVFDGDSLKFKTGIIPKLASNNTFTGTNNFSATQTDFGDGTVIFDLNLTPGEGVFQIRDNSDPLLIYDDDTETWDFQYPVSINGVPITSGGGDAYLANRQTFTKRNVFSDTLKADGLSLIDNARITSNLNVTGDVISDLNFLKGSSTSIGTISTDSLAFITNNTKRIVINKNGYTNFTDTVQMSDYVQINGNLNVGTNIVAAGNILADSIAGIGKFITDINAANLSSGTILQSRLSDSVFKLSNLDTTKFLDQSDTSKYFRLGDIITPITEIVNSLVTFSTTVTFTVSPIFSALVNFPNGINVTGTATFNGDIVANGTYNNYRDTVIRKKLGDAGTVLNVPHGISNWRWITSYEAIIWEDSLQRMLEPGYNATAGLTILPTNYIRDTAYVFYVNSTSVNIGKNPNCAGCTHNDSIIVSIRYLKP